MLNYTLRRFTRSQVGRYRANVITRIVEGHPQRRLYDLLPRAYSTMPALKSAA